MTVKLPLFPLKTVLYPSTPIALHIFEERYRLMIGRCVEQSSSFGVVLIRSGSEVDPGDPYIRQLRAQSGVSGEPEAASETIPFSTGTAVRITECHRLDDGRYYLNAVGLRRFRVQYISHQEPYLIASVAYLPEQTTPDLPALAASLRDLYAHYWQSVAVVTGQQYEIDALPDDPVELSYALAHRLRVPMQRKQRWLEADAVTRLREISDAIRGELALIPGARPGGARWATN